MFGCGSGKFSGALGKKGVAAAQNWDAGSCFRWFVGFAQAAGALFGGGAVAFAFCRRNIGGALGVIGALFGA